MAYYRAGRWQEAVSAIETSTRDYYYAPFAAMACWQVGDRDQAQVWYKRAVAWMSRQAQEPTMFMTPPCFFCMEAAQLMDLKVKLFDRKMPAIGARIQPVGVNAVSHHFREAALRCVDGTGLSDEDEDGLLEHSEDPNHMWLHQRGDTEGGLEFDLDRVHELGSMLVWNYNERGHTSRGIKSADISVWTDENGWQKILDDVAFAEAEGSFDYDEPIHIQLDDVKARKLRLEDLMNLGDAEFIGLSEVQFFQTRRGEE